MMTTRSVMSEKKVVLTEADYDRLRHLAGSPRYRASDPALLAALNDELDQGTVVPPTSVPKGVVTMHSHVRVQESRTGESETYTLVYPDEADINEGRLSVLAPLGMALLGARVGQVVEFDAPAGPRRVKVAKVLYQPEAAGDFHL